MLAAAVATADSGVRGDDDGVLRSERAGGPGATIQGDRSASESGGVRDGDASRIDGGATSEGLGRGDREGSTAGFRERGFAGYPTAATEGIVFRGVHDDGGGLDTGGDIDGGVGVSGIGERCGITRHERDGVRI